MRWKSLSPVARAGWLTVGTTVAVSVLLTLISNRLGLGIESAAVSIGSGIALSLFWPKLFVDQKKNVAVSEDKPQPEGQVHMQSDEKKIAGGAWDKLSSRMEAHMYVSLTCAIVVLFEVKDSLIAILVVLAFVVSVARVNNLFDEIKGHQP